MPPVLIPDVDRPVYRGESSGGLRLSPRVWKAAVVMMWVAVAVAMLWVATGGLN